MGAAVQSRAGKFVTTAFLVLHLTPGLENGEEFVSLTSVRGRNPLDLSCLCERIWKVLQEGDESAEAVTKRLRGFACVDSKDKGAFSCSPA